MGRERCRVVVKCRPCFPTEEEALGDGIDIPAPGKVLLGKEFEADHVYLPSDGDLVYEDEVHSLVASLYDGINSTVFAYGASGSGKTHTMLGCPNSPGLIDRITDEVFARYDRRTCAVSVSVEELYCERFTDLLAASAHPPASSSGSFNSSSSFSSGGGSSSHLHAPRSMHSRPQPAHHRQPSQSKYSWQKVTLHSSSEMKALIQHVLRKRHTASTCLNDKSSRSHVIITVALEQSKAITEHKAYADDDELPQSSDSSVVSAGGASSSMGGVQQAESGETHSVQEDASSEAGSAGGLDTYLIGKLYLVDLAGSENIKRSGAEGARQKEAGEINKSLCHLKTVIEEVFKGGRVTTYRNSKLTFRLQDALGGGTSKLLVVACVSTARSNLLETKETLRFAEMARAITNSPVVNREPKDELIHRLQLQLAELQDQLKLARDEGGKAATEEVLQQLNVVEAAYADLQADMESKEASWTRAAMEVKQQVTTLHEVLSDVQGREASLKQQLVQEQAAMQQLLQQLTAEQDARQDSQQAGAAAAAVLVSMREDVATLLQQCSVLRDNVAQHSVVAAAASSACAEHQQMAQELQQQLVDKTCKLATLMQQLQEERSARAAADIQVAGLETACTSLRQQLTAEQAASASQMAEKQQLLDAQAQELLLLRQQLQQEREVRAAADAQVAVLQQHQQSQQAAAQQCSEEASQGLQALTALCKMLQEQVATAAAHKAAAEQQQAAVLRGLQASEAAYAAVVKKLDVAKQDVCQQQQQKAELQRTLESKLQGALDSVADLQSQLENERSEHKEALAAERQRHSQQLADSMQSSVQRLTADRLRCREHLSPVFTSIKAEAQILSRALASPSPLLTGGPIKSNPTSPGRNDDSGSSSPVGGRDGGQAAQQLSPARRHAEHGSGLELEVSEAMLSDTTAAPMQDASERNLGLEFGDDTGSSEAYSSGYSSGCATPAGGGVMGQAAATAALVAVAAAAAAATATRAAAAFKGISTTPEQARTVSVHVEAGLTDRQQQQQQPQMQLDSTGGGNSCASDGRCSPAPTHSSFGGSQHSGIHPAAAAAASAAAAAVAARVRSSHEQQSQRQRRRRHESTSSKGSWPVSYLPREEVDMAAAAMAFKQLRGGSLNIDSLQNFLEHRMLGGKLHVKTLPGGGKKRKHQLVQDMLAYHRWHLANCSTARSSSSSIGGSGAGGASSAAATLTPRSSSRCSTPDSLVWHPLGLTNRPASAGPSSATSSPVKLDLVRYSYDSPVQAAGGSRSLALQTAPAAAQTQGRAVFALETADAAADRSDVPAAERHQQQEQQQQLSTRWSWLTPRRRKQQSILAQMQAGEKASPKRQQQQQGLDTWPAASGSSAAVHTAEHEQQQQSQLSVQLPERESEGGCDAVSPRDKKHAAAAGRSASKTSGHGSGSSSSSNRQPTTPKGISLNGRAISACTGSAVSEFYVDSPAVKLAGSGGGSKGKHRSTEAGRLSAAAAADVGSAHRMGWRQVQLTRQK